VSTEEAISAEDAARITAYLDVQAPATKPTAHIVFGTNQPTPAEVVADLYHEGLAPLIILTGGVNRHNGIVEAQVHRRILLEHGVPEDVIRYEDTSATTRENVEQALPFLHQALDSGLEVTAVCKWYQRRAIQALRMLFSGPSVNAVTWDPVYGGARVTRSDWWFRSAVGAQRVLREWRVIPERLADGSLREVELIDGAWR
jgi:uncharacterized SAM-binding protein YcdF (DUF218 family)